MLVKEPLNFDVLVNKENWLPKNYMYYDLIVPKVSFLPNTISDSKLLRYDAAKALEKLFKFAKKKHVELVAVSGYRSFERQRTIFKSNYLRDGERANKYSARPGQSEHQTGLAMDVTCRDVNYELVEEFEHTNSYKCLYENAHKFGFIIRYPKGKEDITGYIFEPWHLRYVGKEIAEKLNSEKITLEEYWRKKQKKFT